MPTPKEWTRLLEPYTKSEDGRALRDLLATMTLFALTWTAMYLLVDWSYLATILLSIVAAGFLTRMFIVQHDCGHGSYFSNQKYNDTLGGFIGVFTLTPYEYWRRTHSIHHANSGNLDRRSFGEIDMLTVDEYLSRSRFGRLSYRVYRNPLVLLTIGPIWQFVIKHRFPFDSPLGWKREWRSVIMANIAIVSLVTVACLTMGWRKFLMIQLPISLVTGIIGVWLFYIQHQFNPGYWRRNEEWDYFEAGLRGSSFYDLPAPLRWFSGYIGYHPIHHVAPKIPSYKLKECHESVAEVRETVTRLTFFQSLSCARLALWDEKRKCMVTFRDLKCSDVRA